ncbi:cytochrome c-type biogenesis protein CcmH [Moraxella nasibovis]|uniref:cytochrome c-type biogenesis protein n=1 Tax=Moraxella nasibovis TaxID=2904120 RepID=UPI00240F6F1E|nr:cytochrome c-type biogenesis protein [Moraxella nasibovis]WFF37906.1 cytochrome c-type biogenesis protein CcmH [Moraxella nasibovis]
MKKVVMTALFLGVMTSAWANIEVYEFKTAEDETRYRALIEELRCPKCQNQNLAGSDAPIALDLKQKTYEMINDGRSDTEIRDYMFERYGDFISYKPPVRPSTWILWFFPPLLLVLLIGGWLLKVKRPRAVPEATDTKLSEKEEVRLSEILKAHDKESKR